MGFIYEQFKGEMMKVIIAGGRDFVDSSRMAQVLNQLEGSFLPMGGEGLELVCGMARGADLTAYTLLSSHGYPVIEMPADWDRGGRGAGYKRNVDMARVADKLIAFWDGKSKGTQHMINIMNGLGKPVHVVRYRGA